MVINEQFIYHFFTLIDHSILVIFKKKLYVGCSNAIRGISKLKKHIEKKNYGEIYLVIFKETRSKTTQNITL